MITYALIGDMSTSSATTMRRPIRVGVLLSNVNNSYLSSIQKALEDIQKENIMTGTVGHEPRALAEALYTVGMNCFLAGIL